MCPRVSGPFGNGTRDYRAVSARPNLRKSAARTHDSELTALLRAVGDLFQPPRPPQRRIGVGTR